MSDGVIIGLIAAIPGIIAAWIAMRKTKPEVTQIETTAATAIQDAALDLLEPYKREVEILRQNVDQLSRQNEDMRMKLAQMRVDMDALKVELGKVVHGSYVLYHQVKSAGLTPAYTPPEY